MRESFFKMACLDYLISQQHGPKRASSSDRHPRHRKDVAKLTFDLYKTHPQEFIGCLNVKATLYGMYSISYDLRCYSAKRMMK